MKKVTITGGSGFIGQNLVKYLLNQGYMVFCPVRSPDKALHLQHKNLHVFRDDLLSPQRLTSVIAESNIIFHLAGTIKGVRRADYFNGNLETTKQLLKIIGMSAQKIQKLIYISSQAAAGPCAQEPGLSEHASKANTARPVSNYGRSKLAAEKLIIAESPCPYVILRPAIVYGPADREMLQLFQYGKLGIIPKAGFRKFPVNIIYIKDLLTAIMLAVENKKAEGKTYFVHDTIARDWNEVCRQTGTSMDKKVFILPILKILIQMACQAGGLLSKLTNKPAILNPDKWQEIKQDGWLCDCSAIRKDLQFTPQWDLASGFEETLRWYYDNGWLKKR